MNKDSAMSSGGGLTLRQAALTAGFGLLVMAIAVPLAEFYAFPKLLVSDDMAATIQNIRQNERLFVAGMMGHFLAYALDIVVAWAFYELFRPTHRALSLLTAWFRLAYALVALAGLFHLFFVFHVVTPHGETFSLPADQIARQAELHIKTFRSFWGSALIVFGIHLVLLALLILRSRYVPSIVGVIVAIAGIGYFTYYLGIYLVPEANLGLLFYTSFGELIFMGWLLIRGWSLRLSGARQDAGSWLS